MKLQRYWDFDSIWNWPSWYDYNYNKIFGNELTYTWQVNSDGDNSISVNLPGVDPDTVELKWNDDKVYLLVDGEEKLSIPSLGKKEFWDQEYKWGVMKFKFKIKEEKSDDEVVKF